MCSMCIGVGQGMSLLLERVSRATHRASIGTPPAEFQDIAERPGTICGPGQAVHVAEENPNSRISGCTSRS